MKNPTLSSCSSILARRERNSHRRASEALCVRGKEIRKTQQILEIHGVTFTLGAGTNTPPEWWDFHFVKQRYSFAYEIPQTFKTLLSEKFYPLVQFLIDINESSFYNLYKNNLYRTLHLQWNSLQVILLQSNDSVIVIKQIKYRLKH